MHCAVILPEIIHFKAFYYHSFLKPSNPCAFDILSSPRSRIVLFFSFFLVARDEKLLFYTFFHTHIHKHKSTHAHAIAEGEVSVTFSLWRLGTLLKDTLAVLWKQHLSCYQSAITYRFFQSLDNLATYLISGVNITSAIWLFGLCLYVHQ